jgi:1,4-alpha-glucan branching enzyme
VLGPHDTPGSRIIRTFLPGATKVEIVRRSDGAALSTLEPARESGLFENLVGARTAYRLRIHWPDAAQETQDP